MLSLGSGAIAQLAERRFCIPEVRGSTPLGSTRVLPRRRRNDGHPGRRPGWPSHIWCTLPASSRCTVGFPPLRSVRPPRGGGPLVPHLRRDLVQAVREQVSVGVEGHGRRLVPEHRLNDLHVRPRGEGRGVPRSPGVRGGVLWTFRTPVGAPPWAGRVGSRSAASARTVRTAARPTAGPRAVPARETPRRGVRRQVAHTPVRVRRTSDHALGVDLSAEPHHVMRLRVRILVQDVQCLVPGWAGVHRSTDRHRHQSTHPTRGAGHPRIRPGPPGTTTPGDKWPLKSVTAQPGIVPRVAIVLRVIGRLGRSGAS